MKTVRLHGIYKNLPSNTIYNSQAAWLIFTLGMAFKVTSAPGIISKEYGSSTFWAYLALAAAELIITVAIFAFIRNRSDDLLILSGSRAYRVLCLVSAIWLTLKGTFYFSYCITYLTHELFGGVEPSLVYILFLAPIVYLGIKGLRSVSRTTEIVAPLLFLFILFNMIFLKTDLDFGRNLPIFSLPPKDFFAGLFRYGLWLGDAFPLIFARIKNKRLPYVCVGVGGTAVLVLMTVLLGVATYGEALKTVTDLLVRLAGFNLLSLEIGRMEWTNLFGVVAMSILSISFIYYGVNAATERSIYTAIPSKMIFPLTVGLVVLIVPSSQAVSDFSVEWMGYIMFAFAALLPLSALLLGKMYQRRYPGTFEVMDSEYAPYPHDPPKSPDSLADNFMTSYKELAKHSLQANKNGELKEEG